MRKVFEIAKKSAGLWLALIIIAQTVIYVLAGMSKAYFHMDEVYSYGLANHERVQIYETEGFYDTWHEGSYYDEYLTVSDDERGDFWPVYENQRNDVHPPLFYFLLRIGMEMTPGQFSKWTGLVLNILIAGVSTVVLWMVVKNLTNGQKVKSLALTAVVALGMAAVSTVVYIRMYELLTLWVLLTTWLHLKLLETREVKPRLLVAIGAVELLGALTQYYYWFYLAAMFMVFVVRYIRMKKWKELRAYVAVIVGAGLLSLVVWPFAIQHMFFGYRGEGVMATLLQPLMLLENLWVYAGVMNEYVFHRLLLVVVLGLLLIGGYVILKGKEIKTHKTQAAKVVMILVPTLFYLVIVAAASPFAALRYVAPVCGLVLVIVFWSLWGLFEGVWGRKWGNLGMVVVLAIFSLVMPVFAGLEPDVVYREREVWLEKVEAVREVPALYLMKTGDDWGFLNDILLMRELQESYIAEDVGADKDKIREILKGKDLKGGLLVFINDGQEQGEVLEAVKAATGLKDADWSERLVMSDMYYLK